MSVRDFHFFGKTAGEKKKVHHDEKTENTDYEKKIRPDADELDVSGLDALSEEQTFGATARTKSWNKYFHN